VFVPFLRETYTRDKLTHRLYANGPEFDRLFLLGMIQHHNGALILVKDLFDTVDAPSCSILQRIKTADGVQR